MSPQSPKTTVHSPLPSSRPQVTLLFPDYYHPHPPPLILFNHKSLLLSSFQHLRQTNYSPYTSSCLSPDLTSPSPKYKLKLKTPTLAEAASQPSRRLTEAPSYPLPIPRLHSYLSLRHIYKKAQGAQQHQLYPLSLYHSAPGKPKTDSLALLSFSCPNACTQGRSLHARAACV